MRWKVSQPHTVHQTGLNNLGLTPLVFAASSLQMNVGRKARLDPVPHAVSLAQAGAAAKFGQCQGGLAAGSILIYCVLK